MLNIIANIIVIYKSNKNIPYYQNMDIAHQLKAELEKNQLPNIEILKIASENAVK